MEMDIEVAMPSTSSQYDIELGGNTELPFSFHLGEYVEGHIEELKALTQAIENPTRTKLTFQRLPKHMRRRVMSHNVKRMPRRLREAHAAYLEKQNLKISKRPSRKFRRRPKNLLQEYNRRQRIHVWLETHIWHAKRFNMVKQWGYKLPYYPNEKSYRACLRAMNRYCLLQDISYMSCIELNGSSQYLIDNLLKHTNSCTGFNINAKFYMNGYKEGNLMFFERDNYPYGAIGQISFLWKPITHLELTSERTLWIWCHPSFYCQVRDQLIQTFEFEQCRGIAKNEDEQRETENVGVDKDISKKSSKKKKTKSPKNVESTKLALKNIPFSCKIPMYRNKQGVTMCLLKDVLNRFRLTGPLSGVVIADAFKLFDHGQNTEEDLQCSELAQSKRDLENNEELKNVWKLLDYATSSQFPPKCILGAVIQDPRFNMPPQRTRNDLNQCEEDGLLQLLSLHNNVSRSSIWDYNVRDHVSTHKLSTHQVNQIFSQRLVSGVCSPLEKEFVAPIPVLLIQQEGNKQNEQKRNGFGSGWDIVFPAGWSMPLWLALIFNGARVGGLREANNLNVEMGIAPTLQCDMLAWNKYEKEKTDCVKEKYFRKPSKKRPNYIKLGITNPFSFPWNVLLNDWKEKGNANDEKNTMRVSDRDKRIEHNNETTLNQQKETMDIAKSCDREKGIEKNDIEKEDLTDSKKYYVLRDKKIINQLNNILKITNTNESIQNLFENIKHPNHCLLQINIKLIKRGKLDKYAQICLPHQTDLQENNDPIKEKQHFDNKQKIRNILKIKHKKLLTKLRRKRIKIKKKCDELNGKRIKRKEGPTKEICEMYKKIMEKLWLNEVKDDDEIDINKADNTNSDGEQELDKMEINENIIHKQNVIRKILESKDEDMIEEDLSKANETYGKQFDMETNSKLTQESIVKTNSKPIMNKQNLIQMYLKNIKDVKINQNQSSCSKTHGDTYVSNKQDSINQDPKKNKKTISSTNLFEYVQSMLTLLKTLRWNCSRQLMGFIQSEYYHSINNFQGYITLNSFKQLIQLLFKFKINQFIILVRNIKQYHYHRAQFNII